MEKKQRANPSLTSDAAFNAANKHQGVREKTQSR
jgi:hypothetical protein